MTRLNLGCGNKKYKDFINIDIREDVQPDMCMNITCLDKFKDKTVDFILAHDILEHFSHREIWAVLKEWIRCLKIGGQIEIQVPSIDRIYADRDNLINRYRGDSSLRFSQLIFGGQDYASNFHFVCFTYEFFQLVAKTLNLKIVKYNETVGNYNHSVIFEKLK